MLTREEKYEIMLKHIVDEDFGGDLTEIQTETVYDKYDFYCKTMEIRNQKNRQAFIRDICDRFGYKSKQKWIKGTRVCVFERKVSG